MSYDVTVYGARSIGGGELADLVSEVNGLSVEPVDEQEIRVLRGRRRSYSFTISGPHDVDDDVPDQVVPHVLDPTISWQLLVEGSYPTEVPHALRFAKKLAQAADGVAYDEQTSEVLGATKRRVAPPSDSELVRLLRLEWYSPVTAPPAAGIWLELAKRCLPEALPRRYDGDAMFFSCQSLPCRDGSWGTVPFGGLLSDGLTVVADTCKDPRWRNVMRQFFVEFARRRGAVLACGEVLRYHRLKNRGAPGTVYRGESTDALRGVDGLLGLPPRPVWWTWFGTDYLPLVREYLPAEGVTEYTDGVLFEAMPDPADRGQLADLPDPIPAGLRAKPIPTEPNVRKHPSVTAADVRLV